MKLRTSDTIAAIATPIGEGAISIIRVSGPDAISFTDRVFRGRHALADTPGYTIRHGAIVGANGAMVDEVLASVFRTPNSYTGEDSIEISGHGGIYVTRKVLSLLLEAGARQADPGEFTKRAFLNGKIDLAQAEAVGDLIRARSDRALRNSAARLGGFLGEMVMSLKKELTEICSLLELQLDFSEEDVALAPPKEIVGRLTFCEHKIESLLSTFERGKVIRDGGLVAIVGRPNVGKSSLFNRLLMEDRSIISPVAGTTRDFLEENIVIDGVPVRLVDTAGLREDTFDGIEAMGISKTRALIGIADLVILVLDPSQGETLASDMMELGKIVDPRRVIPVRNKADLILRNEVVTDNNCLRVSAETGEGVLALQDRIGLSLLGDGSVIESDILVCSTRQAESLRSCLSFLTGSIASVDAGMTYEFVASDLSMAISSLSEITGEITTDDILDSIFSRFCIGK